jgi:hypothetical protein
MKVCVYLDSGAYAAWRRGEEINIDEYIDYIKRNEDYIDHYINLDVIPGRPGYTPTQEEVDKSANQSYLNLQKMKHAGLNPIPVFHQGEQFYWLDKLIEDGDEYIGISPAEDMIGWRGPSPHIWLDRVFNHITDTKGVPVVKTHGFGVAKHQLLLRYPWTTCDSTTWTQYPNHGSIVVPIYKNDKPAWILKPLLVHVSDITRRKSGRFGSAKSAQKNQYGNLSLLEQSYVRRFVEENGLTMTQVRYDDGARRVCMISYYTNLCKQLGDNVRFKFKKRFF